MLNFERVCTTQKLLLSEHFTVDKNEIFWIPETGKSQENSLDTGASYRPNCLTLQQFL